MKQDNNLDPIFDAQATFLLKNQQQRLNLINLLKNDINLKQIRCWGETEEHSNLIQWIYSKKDDTFQVIVRQDKIFIAFGSNTDGKKSKIFDFYYTLLHDLIPE